MDFEQFDNCSSFDQIALKEAFIMSYLDTIIVTIGTVGNFLAVLAFLKSELIKLPSSNLLAAKCLSDTFFFWTSLYMDYVGS